MEGATDASSVPELHPSGIAGGDPLLARLTRSGATPVAIGIAYSGVFTLIKMLAALLAGHLRTIGTVTGFLNDPGIYANLVLGAAVCAYYVWMPRGIAAVFNGLSANEVIGTPTADARSRLGKSFSHTSFLSQLQRVCNRRRWAAVSLAIAGGATLSLVLPGYLRQMEAQVSWAFADPVNLALSLLWVLLGIYAVVVLLTYCVLSIYWLRRLFKDFFVHVRPLHPDQAGGLSPLGGFSLSLSYLASLIGVGLAVTPVVRHYVAHGEFRFEWTTDILVGLGIYAVVAPGAFFASLSVAHGAMKEAKHQLLLQIAQRFDAEYAGIQNALGADVPDLDRNLERLGKLQALYETTEKFPVWPFNVESVVRFATTFFSPIALAILTDILSRLFMR